MPGYVVTGTISYRLGVAGKLETVWYVVFAASPGEAITTTFNYVTGWVCAREDAEAYNFIWSSGPATLQLGKRGKPASGKRRPRKKLAR